MNRTKIITMSLLLAALAVGCSKDNSDNRLRIFAEGFSGNNHKVLITPSTPSSGATWVVGETIKLGSDVYTITQSSDGQDFNLELNSSYAQELEGTTSAFYPGDSFGGNDVIVSDNEIVLNKLVVYMNSDGTEKIAFPMAAHGDAGDNVLAFRHLSAGMQLTMTANSSVNVASLKVVAQSDSPVVPITCDYDDDNTTTDDIYTARWGVQGPSVPTGAVGTNPDEVNVKYISEMNFDLKSGSNNFVTVSNGNNLVLCIPITISSVKRLVVTGFAADGTELFNKTASFSDEVEVLRNKMYTAPSISIN